MATYYTALDVAQWFLTKKPMSHKKIQKLVYYAYAWTLALLNDNSTELYNKLFDEKIEAWVHGAVIRDLYYKFSEYGWKDIPQISEDQSVICKDMNNSDVKDILNQVWQVYGKYSANELESINHKEKPWKNARIGLAPNESSSNTISNEDIFNYYNE